MSRKSRSRRQFLRQVGVAAGFAALRLRDDIGGPSPNSALTITNNKFISGAGALSGASGEAKERAVAAFYERLVVLERQLGQIQEELQLG